MACGNEPGGHQDEAYLADYVGRYRKADPRRLWTSGSGWPELAENQFHVSGDPRIQRWGEGLSSRVNAKPPETVTDYRDFIAERSVPVVSHEIGQWCVYPNFDELPEYTGLMQPKNFEIFRDRLAAHGLMPFARRFLMASGKLQTLCYKEDIESALRTPGMGGFELLDLHDFPGQGTALVGVLDPFWEEKGYVTAGEYRRFCNATVPLARLGKRVFTTDETLEVPLEVAHYGPAPMVDAVAHWQLVGEDGLVFARGDLEVKRVPVGNGTVLGRIRVPLQEARAPRSYRLVVGLEAPKQGCVENDWRIWVYQALPQERVATGVRMVSHLDEPAEAYLRAGGRLLLTLPAKSVRTFEQAPVAMGFSPIFWNTAWTHRQPPTTLGLLCDPEHPALASFPTAFHSDWQWWYLVHRAGALRLDGLPKGFEPIVRVIDDWTTARPLGLILEAKIGSGRIVVCGFDLTGSLKDPVSRQMRRSLLEYMEGDSFQPVANLSFEQVRNLITER